MFTLTCILSLSVAQGVRPQEREPDEMPPFTVTAEEAIDRVEQSARQTVMAAWEAAANAFDLDRSKMRDPWRVRVMKGRAPGSVSTNGQAVVIGRTHRTIEVRITPACSNGVLETIGLPMPSRRALARAVATVAFERLDSGAEHRPPWWRQGGPSWIADVALVRAGMLSSSVDDPDMSTRLLHVRKLAATGRLPSVGDILAGRLSSMDPVAREHVYWLFAEYILRIAPDGLFARFSDTRGIAGAEAEELAPLDRQFAAYIQGQEPLWAEVQPSLTTAGDAWTQVAPAVRHAIAWRAKPINRTEYSIGGRLRILRGSAKRMSVLLDRNESGYIAVAFEAGRGLTVREYRPAEERWVELDRAQSIPIATARDLPFKIVVRSGRLAVSVGGRSVMNVDVSHRSMRGAWGLGARAGTAGLWQEMRVSAPSTVPGGRG